MTVTEYLLTTKNRGLVRAGLNNKSELHPVAKPLVRSVSTVSSDCYNRHIKTGYAHLIKPVQFGQIIGNTVMSHISESFIAYSANYGFSTELANAVIDQFGGFKQFGRQASSFVICQTEKGITGWSKHEETLDFYKTNKAAIKKWLSDSHAEFEYECLVPEYVQKMNIVQKEDFSTADIEMFLVEDNEEQDGYIDFSSAISWQVAYDLSCAYSRWYESIMGG